MISDGELKIYATATQYHEEDIQAVAAELLQRREDERKTCKWKINRAGFVATECGHGWAMSDNYSMDFCRFCGHRIEEVQL